MTRGGGTTGEAGSTTDNEHGTKFESTARWQGAQRYWAGTAGGTTAAKLAAAVQPVEPAVLPLKMFDDVIL